MMTRRTLFGCFLGAGAGATSLNALSRDASEKPPRPGAEKRGITFYGWYGQSQYGIQSLQSCPQQTNDPSKDIVIAMGEDNYLWVRQHGQWKRMVS